jgi:hypothetical protein
MVMRLWRWLLYGSPKTELAAALEWPPTWPSASTFCAWLRVLAEATEGTQPTKFVRALANLVKSILARSQRRLGVHENDSTVDGLPYLVPDGNLRKTVFHILIEWGREGKVISNPEGLVTKTIMDLMKERVRQKDVRQKREVELRADVAENAADSGGSPPLAVTQVEGFTRLPERDQKVLQLRAEGLTRAEIGEKLGPAYGQDGGSVPGSTIQYWEIQAVKRLAGLEAEQDGR